MGQNGYELQLIKKFQIAAKWPKLVNVKGYLNVRWLLYAKVKYDS